MESRQTVLWCGEVLGGEEIERKRKKEKELKDTGKSVVTAVERGLGGGGRRSMGDTR